MPGIMFNLSYMEKAQVKSCGNNHRSRTVSLHLLKTETALEFWKEKRMIFKRLRCFGNSGCLGEPYILITNANITKTWYKQFLVKSKPKEKTVIKGGSIII